MPGGGGGGGAVGRSEEEYESDGAQIASGAMKRRYGKHRISNSIWSGKPTAVHMTDIHHGDGRLESVE